MGESKRKAVRLAEQLSAASGCIYCAGIRAATTMDHMPPRSVFWGKLRPKGLEFPCCVECNAGTRLADHVAALLSRLLPDAATPVQRADVKKYIDGVGNNIPGLLSELFGPLDWAPRKASLPDGLHALHIGGPLVTGYMGLFAAKFGLAMHHVATGHALPASGGLAVRWYGNGETEALKIPAELVATMGPLTTLAQGRFNVSDQFQYTLLAEDDGARAAFIGAFRRSFVVVGTSSVDWEKERLAIPNAPRIWRPGDLAREGAIVAKHHQRAGTA